MFHSRRLGRVLTLTTLPILVSGCISLGNLSPSMELPSEVDVQKFAACMAPHLASIEPGFELLVTSLGKLPATGTLSTKLSPLLELDAGFLENRWNVQSRLQRLLLALSTDVRATHRSNHEYIDVSEDIRRSAQRFADPSQLISRHAPKRVEAYLRAYFTRSERPGHPVAIDAERRSRLRTKLSREFGVAPDDPKIEQAIAALGFESGTTTPEIAQPAGHESGFIGADGTVYAFPGITADHAGRVTIDHSQIGADLIRIVFEALRDHYAPLPVVANSTAAWITHQCKAPTHSYCEFKDDPITELDWSDREVLDFTWHPDRANGIPGWTGKIDRADYEDLEAYARNAEASTAAAVGKAIRGGSWGSLNNEAVAKLIETAAGVLARQTTARAQWCARYAGPAVGNPR